jgi:putative colanic acid biosynthesis UDP-glucose lipid carrier transferase
VERQLEVEQVRAVGADSIAPGSSVPLWKTLEDYVLGSVLLLLAVPLLAATALAVRLGSPGPIFFRQERLTLDGRRFSMLKFRTLPLGTGHEALGGEIRTGRLGMFLRRTSLDELPQLWNVLRGEMAIVGPRPERPVFAQALEREVPGFARRTRVKAGITGWAQIHGLRGGTTELRRRVDYDLWYVDHHSLSLDLRILAATLTRFWNHAARRSHAPELEQRVLGEREKPRRSA